MRYERKWYIKKISKPELNLILKRQKVESLKEIKSIYFDNLKLSSVKDNLDGINITAKK